jgi:hypothetical protein
LRIGFFTFCGLVCLEPQKMKNFVILKEKEIIISFWGFIGYASTKVLKILFTFLRPWEVMKNIYKNIFFKFGSKFSFLEEPLMDLDQSLSGQVHN